MVAGLSLTNVVIDYHTRMHSVRAVDHVSLHVHPGEVVALMGASGSGKSSLLRAIAGIEQLTSGDISWNGESVVAVPTYRRGFGMMFQQPHLFAHYDVAGNIGYGLAQLPRRERAARVAELLDLVGLAEYERRRVTQLSGGQAQRVALARALAPRPKVLLLDEPLSALDAELRQQLVHALADILTATGTTAVYVTHDRAEAHTIGQRVEVMIDGTLQQG